MGMVARPCERETDNRVVVAIRTMNLRAYLIFCVPYLPKCSDQVWPWLANARERGDRYCGCVVAKHLCEPTATHDRNA